MFRLVTLEDKIFIGTANTVSVWLVSKRDFANVLFLTAEFVADFSSGFTEESHPPLVCDQ
jgi:hypothetical protein